MWKMIALSVLTLTILFYIGCGGSGGSSSETVPSSRYVTLAQVAALHDDVRETSGLAKIEGRLYTHNDSGDGPLLYELNASDGTIVRTITVNGADNVDWEDLAYDDTYLYVADIGNNNLPPRADLKIYRIARAEIENNLTVNAETITVTYEGQGVVAPYDAEGLVAYGGKLYIFTKGWDDNRSRVYSLDSNTTAAQVATLESERLFDVLITGAARSDVSGEIVLTGYSNPLSIAPADFKIELIRLRGFSGDDPFSGTVTTYEVTESSTIGQVEAVAFDGVADLYITAEGVTVEGVPYPAVFYRGSLSE